MSTARANPFDDLSDFDTQTKPPPPAAAAIEQIAEAAGFPSRKARSTEKTPSAPPPKVRRRYTTGRNQQINVKATAETIDRLYRIADDLKQPLGAVLDLALDALETQHTGKKR